MAEKLTPQEEQAMNAIWKVKEGTVKSFLTRIPAPKPPYTTLASTIKNLEKKGYVKSKQIGKTYLYIPAVDEITYKKTSLTHLVKHHFGNSYKSLVAFFVEQNKMSATELKEIINMIEKKEK